MRFARPLPPSRVIVGAMHVVATMTMARNAWNCRAAALGIVGSTPSTHRRVVHGPMTHSASARTMTGRSTRDDDDGLGRDDEDLPPLASFGEMTVSMSGDELRYAKSSAHGRKEDALMRRLHEHRTSRSRGGDDDDVEIGKEEDDDCDVTKTVASSTGGGIDPTDSIITTVDDDAIRERDANKDERGRNLDVLTVVDLRMRLKMAGLSMAGRKSVLIDRLIRHQSSSSLDDDETAVSRRRRRRRRTTVVEGGKSTIDDGDSTTTMDTLDGVTDLIDPSSSKDDILDETRDEQQQHLDEFHDDEHNDKDNISVTGESTRRARRKKFWKAREVRELIKTNDPRAPSKAEEMISTLEDMARREDEREYLPGPFEYALLIDAYSRTGSVVDAIRRAEDVIDRLLVEADNPSSSGGGDGGGDGSTDNVTPAAHVLNAVMSTYANIGDVESASRASTILERMEYLRRFGKSTIRPTMRSYSIAISAWAKCGSRASAEMAEGILNRLMRDYDADIQNDDVLRGDEYAPNNYVFNSVIDAWARSGSSDAGEKADALLRRMEVSSKTDKYDCRIHPDTISFNTCIKAWCNSNMPDAPLRAEEILNMLETYPQYPKRGGGVVIVRPNKLSYNTVINSWAKSQSPESALRAEAILLRMMRSYKSDPSAAAAPDAVTFSSVLNALAKSKTARMKAEKCGHLLRAMIDLHENDGGNSDTRPNRICYNTVLNACAFSAHGGDDERSRALAVAVEIFNQMRRDDHVSPDAVSYGNMLKACANLMSPGERRSAIAARFFISCRDDGLVGGMCLDEIRRCVPPREFLTLLADCGYDKPLRRRRQSHTVTLHELPPDWTANVASTDMASRQRGSFIKQKKTSQPIGDKLSPVIPRPGLIVEYGASGRDL